MVLYCRILTEIKSITLVQNDKKYPFPKEAIQNIFQPTTEAPYFGVAVGTDNHLFLYMSNSDGAGSYEVVWTIKNGEVFNQFLYRNF